MEGGGVTTVAAVARMAVRCRRGSMIIALWLLGLLLVLEERFCWRCWDALFVLADGLRIRKSPFNDENRVYRVPMSYEFPRIISRFPTSPPLPTSSVNPHRPLAHIEVRHDVEVTELYKGC